MQPLEVIWIPDHMIKPPGPKMVVCIQPYMGFFFRINSHSNWEPCVPIAREPHHRFLRHDSFIECRILELDDYIIAEAMRGRGVIGRVSRDLCEPLCVAIGGAGFSRDDRTAIRAVLEPLIPRIKR